MWHTVWNEDELEAFISAGWTQFTLRPDGSAMGVFITPDMYKRHVARLATPSFSKISDRDTWQMFRELMTGLRYGQVRVPGPLTAHDLATLAPFLPPGYLGTLYTNQSISTPRS